MRSFRWVPVVVLGLVAGSLVVSSGAAADEAVTSPASVDRQAPTCMSKSTYQEIKKKMTYSKVKKITKGQKAAFKIPGTDNPYFIYEGCGWTGGKGVLLTFERSTLTDPLRSAKLTDKRLNPCGTVPVCA